MNEILKKTLENHELPMIENSIFNDELNKIEKLKWIPWIGKEYEQGKILFIGDSNYNDGAPVNDEDWTRVFIYIEGYNKEKSQMRNSRLLRSIEKTLLNEKHKEEISRKKLWDNVSYLNLSQKPVDVIDGKYLRPSYQDFLDGWDVLLKSIIVLKPLHIIKWGIDGDNSLIDFISNKTNEWEINVNKKKNETLGIMERKHKITHLSSGYSVDVLYTNHPSGSRGYKTDSWRDFIFDNSLEMKKIFN